MKNQKKLSRAEMKNVLGGKVSACSCTGSTGSWTYTDTPTAAQVIYDIQTYCSSGTGNCS